MKKCFVCIGVYDRYEGVIIDDVIYFESPKTESVAIGENTYEVVEIEGAEKELLTMMEMEMYIYNGDDKPVKFSVNGLWGLVDVLTGKIIIDPTWDFIGHIHNGIIRVGLGGHVTIDNGYDDYLLGGKYGYIDEKGEVIIPVEYEEVSEKSYNGYFMVFKDSKISIVNKDNIVQENLTEEEINEIEKHINYEWNGDKLGGRILNKG